MEFWEDYETLRIETPEGLDLYLPLAGFGPRFVAFLIDSLAIAVVEVILVFVGMFILFAGAMGSAATGDKFEWVMIVTMIVMILIFLFAPIIYFMLFESLWSGQSPGKRVAGIRVVRRGGYPVGRREIVTRNLLRIIDMQPITNNMVGLVSFFATRNQQRVGDLMADTVVIREFAGKRPVSAPQLHGDAGIDLARPGTLSPQVSYVISSYLQRAAELEPEARESLSLKCIEALGYSGSHLTLQQRESYLTSIFAPQPANQGGYARPSV